MTEDVNGYRLIQWLRRSEHVSSWIENLGIGQNRLNAFLKTQRSVDQTAWLSDILRAEAWHGSGSDLQGPSPWSLSGQAEEVPLQQIPPRIPTTSSFSGQRRSLRNTGVGLAMPPESIRVEVEEAGEADRKLLGQAALTQAVLGGVMKTQGPHK